MVLGLYRDFPIDCSKATAHLIDDMSRMSQRVAW